VTCRGKYIAASFVEILGFEERIIYNLKSHMNNIVLWDYDNLHSIEPVLLLICPMEVVCFQWNPKDPYQIVAGTMNGQIFMWDLKQGSQIASQKS